MPTHQQTTPSLNQLQRALQIARDIERLQAELNTMLGSRSSDTGDTVGRTSPSTPTPGRGKRRMSPAARAKLAAAARARWAKVKGAATAPEPAGASASAGEPKAKAKSKKRRRTMSAETRAKLAEAAKRRWAERKKQ